MIKLKDLMKENEEFQQLPSNLKKHFLEIISTYGQHREGISRKSDIRQVAEECGKWCKPQDLMREIIIELN